MGRLESVNGLSLVDIAPAISDILVEKDGDELVS